MGNILFHSTNKLLCPYHIVAHLRPNTKPFYITHLKGSLPSTRPQSELLPRHGIALLLQSLLILLLQLLVNEGTLCRFVAVRFRLFVPSQSVQLVSKTKHNT